MHNKLIALFYKNLKEMKIKNMINGREKQKYSINNNTINFIFLQCHNIIRK